MGNVCHSGPVTAKREAPAGASPPKKKLTFGRDPALKREDFIFSRITVPSLLLKQPGSVNGQQFLVEDCRDCDIFVLDHCTSVQIDECVNCRIVVGPCQGSLFLRNCSGCTVVCAVQQFRTRDCKDCDVYLYSATEPIIELSARMRFACFPLTYFSLQQQFDTAKFSVWNNCWSEIYNFTPDHGTWQPIVTPPHESPLQSALQKEEGGELALWKMPSWTAESIGLTTEPKQLIVPLTSGITSRREDTEALVVCFVTPSQPLMLEFATQMVAPSGESSIELRGILLIRTRQMKLTPEQAKILFKDDDGLLAKAAKASESSAGSVIMEFQGAASLERARELLASSTFAGLDGVFLSSDSTSARATAELVFQQWRPTI